MSGSKDFSMRDFSKANLDRCVAPNGFNHPLDSWSASDWFVATVGELGEAANIVKKLNRVRDGIPGNKETLEELKKKLAAELADVYIYLDLICQRQGIDLGEAVVEKFNAKSAEIGYSAPFPELGDLNPELGPEHREFWLGKLK